MGVKTCAAGISFHPYPNLPPSRGKEFRGGAVTQSNELPVETGVCPAIGHPPIHEERAMNAHFMIAVIALCGMLLGLPAAQAADKFV